MSLSGLGSAHAGMNRRPLATRSTPERTAAPAWRAAVNGCEVIGLD
jgi:hypothetical protein